MAITPIFERKVGAQAELPALETAILGTLKEIQELAKGVTPTPRSGANCVVPTFIKGDKLGVGSGISQVQVFDEVCYIAAPRAAYTPESDDSDYTNVPINYIGALEIPAPGNDPQASIVQGLPFKIIDRGEKQPSGDSIQIGITDKGVIEFFVPYDVRSASPSESAAVLDILNQIKAQLFEMNEYGSYLHAPYSNTQLPVEGRGDELAHRVAHLPGVLRNFVQSRTSDIGGAIQVAEWGLNIANTFLRNPEVIRAWASMPHEKRAEAASHLEQVSSHLPPLALECALLVSGDRLKSDEQVVNYQLRKEGGIVGAVKNLLN